MKELITIILFALAINTFAMTNYGVHTGIFMEKLNRVNAGVYSPVKLTLGLEMGVINVGKPPLKSVKIKSNDRHKKTFIKGEKRNKRTLILVLIGLLSLLPLILIAQSQIFGYIGFVFFFFATGLGYLLSRKEKNGKRNRLPEALFLISILGNLVGALFAFVFKDLD